MSPRHPHPGGAQTGRLCECCNWGLGVHAPQNCWRPPRGTSEVPGSGPSSPSPGSRWREGMRGGWGGARTWRVRAKEATPHCLSRLPTDVGRGSAWACLCLWKRELRLEGTPVCRPGWGPSPGSLRTWGGGGLFPVRSRAQAGRRESRGPHGAPGRSDLVASHRCHPHGGTHRPRRAQRQPGCRAPQLLPEQPRPAAGAPAPLGGEGRQAAGAGAT